MVTGDWTKLIGHRGLDKADWPPGISLQRKTNVDIGKWRRNGERNGGSLSPGRRKEGRIVQDNGGTRYKKLQKESGKKAKGKKEENKKKIVSSERKGNCFFFSRLKRRKKRANKERLKHQQGDSLCWPPPA